ncbi:MAG: copper chaperone PCu(A)C [Actinomycetia bacterium]|nr:copper chaperone PCu(A)C [Actinomycetes bacterium]
MVLQGGSQADDLVGASVSSDVAAEAQVHETTADDGMTDDSMAGDEGDMSADEGMSDDSMTDDSMTDEGMSEDDMGGGSGMMTMQEVEEVPVPADGSVALEPGGYHIMLLDLAADLTAGDTVEVTLLFSSGAEETIDAEVRDS